MDIRATTSGRAVPAHQVAEQFKTDDRLSTELFFAATGGDMSFMGTLEVVAVRDLDVSHYAVTVEKQKVDVWQAPGAPPPEPTRLEFKIAKNLTGSLQRLRDESSFQNASAGSAPVALQSPDLRGPSHPTAPSSSPHDALFARAPTSEEVQAAAAFQTSEELTMELFLASGGMMSGTLGEASVRFTPDGGGVARAPLLDIFTQEKLGNAELALSAAQVASLR